jgi:hypothetical protein
MSRCLGVWRLGLILRGVGKLDRDKGIEDRVSSKI